MSTCMKNYLYWKYKYRKTVFFFLCQKVKPCQYSHTHLVNHSNQDWDSQYHIGVPGVAVYNAALGWVHTGWESRYSDEHIQIVVLFSLNSKPPVDDNTDPSAGLMSMLKKIYSEGDDEMKRTINKAWSESQEKKIRGEEGMMDFWTVRAAGHAANITWILNVISSDMYKSHFHKIKRFIIQLMYKFLGINI